jgi:hypothetical protein
MKYNGANHLIHVQYNPKYGKSSHRRNRLLPKRKFMAGRTEKKRLVRRSDHRLGIIIK